VAGTAACAHGRFYCTNAGHEAALLFSSRVNDGVCGALSGQRCGRACGAEPSLSRLPDCCDGSDEWRGRVACANTCLEDGRAAREALTQRAQAYAAVRPPFAPFAFRLYLSPALAPVSAEAHAAAPARHTPQGVAARGRLAAEGRAAQAAWRVELAATETALADQEALVADVTAKKDAAEADERAAAAAAEAEAAAARAAAGEPEPGAAAAEDAAQTPPAEGPAQEAPPPVTADEGAPAEETAEERGRRIARQWTNDVRLSPPFCRSFAPLFAHARPPRTQAAAAGPTPDDVGAARLAAVGHPDANAAAAAEVTTGGGGGDYTADAEDDPDEEELAPMAGGEAADAEALAAEGIEDTAASGDGTGMVARIAGRVRSWLAGKSGVAAGARRRAKTKTNKAAGASSGSDAAPAPAFETAEAATLRAAHTRATTKLAELKARAEELRGREAATDGGADGALLGLVGRCFEARIDTYVYHACPFAGARQEPGAVSLGTNSGGVVAAEGGGEDGGLIMHFQGGLACWNGPQRSLRLELRCGAATALTRVDEPSRCEYAGVLETPAACDAAEAAQLAERAEQARRAAEAAYAQAAHSEL